MSDNEYNHDTQPNAVEEPKPIDRKKLGWEIGLVIFLTMVFESISLYIAQITFSYSYVKVVFFSLSIYALAVLILWNILNHLKFIKESPAPLIGAGIFTFIFIIVIYGFYAFTVNQETINAPTAISMAGKQTIVLAKAQILSYDLSANGGATPWINAPTGVVYDISTPPNTPFHVYYWDGESVEVKGEVGLPKKSPATFKVVNKSSLKIQVEVSGL